MEMFCFGSQSSAAATPLMVVEYPGYRIIKEGKKIENLD